ncbi:MAG TPA: maleylpyruvate isomerase N-terminal domain-containing protein [Candidatus Limnocylindrales bacterium]|nr:maleylpyruvate isomerase N-terminal domain-containing protein [Candidatus Limnocylindrales bacterium]
MTTVKDDILGRIDADEAAWRQLVSEVPAGRRDEPGPMGEWSFRDLVSHLLAWRNRTTSRLQAAAAGAPRPAAPWPAEMDDDDPINGWFRDQDAGRSAHELLDDYAASFGRLRSAVAALPADAFIGETDTPGYFTWRDTAGEVQSDFTGHLADHASDVRAWLSKG